MRVLYFHQHFSTPRGSTGIRSYEMARALIAGGHEVTMVCGSYGGGTTGLSGPFHRGLRRGVVDGINVVELRLAYSNKDSFLKRSSTFLTFALRSVAIALREPCDLVFATTTPLTAGIPGIIARWMRGKPFVFEVRDLWPELPRAMGVIRNPIVLAALSALEWASARSAHRLIGLSPGIVDGIARLGVARSRIAMLPNGCDLDIFASRARPWRPQGIAGTDLMAVFAGTHGIANGLHAVLDAAQELKARRRLDIKIVLIGDGALKAPLRERALREQLTNVLFLNPVGKARLAQLLAGADLGLQILANVPAFYYGTSPNKFFDYIAAGLPVLNNYPGWLAEMIQGNGCGLVVPGGAPGEFADALEWAAEHRDELKAMGTRAQALARKKFDRRELAGKFVEILERAVEQPAC